MPAQGTVSSSRNDTGGNSTIEATEGLACLSGNGKVVMGRLPVWQENDIHFKTFRGENDPSVPSAAIRIRRGVLFISRKKMFRFSRKTNIYYAISPTPGEEGIVRSWCAG